MYNKFAIEDFKVNEEVIKPRKVIDIAPETVLRITSNINSGYTLFHRNSNSKHDPKNWHHPIVMKYMGDMQTVEYGMLKDMHLSNPDHLLKGFVVILDVLSDEYTLEDVLYNLDYGKLLKVSLERTKEFTDLIGKKFDSDIEQVSFKDCVEAIEKLDHITLKELYNKVESSIKMKLLEAFKYLHKMDRLHDYNKIKIVADLTDQDTDSLVDDFELYNTPIDELGIDKELGSALSASKHNPNAIEIMGVGK